MGFGMDSSGRYFTIAQISDFHVGRVIPFPSGEVDLFNQLVRTVDFLNALDPGPDMVMVTGDLVNHGKLEDYRRVRGELDRLLMPYYLAAGNHDQRKSLIEVFNDHSYLKTSDGFLHYSLEDKPLRIVTLDTLEPGTHYGLLCKTRLDWLERVLSEQPDRPTIIFMHHPPFETGMPYPDSLGMRGKQALGEIIRRNPQVEAISSGHTHRDASLRWNGTVAYTVPSSSFSYKLEFHEVDDLDPLLEPIACRVFRWDPTVGLVSHLNYIGPYEYGITEGVPAPPSV
jgi:3',5'-cyclic-AMP phosphodiesterase